MGQPQHATAEHRRLDENRRGTRNWTRWGPYVSDRAWGTVREDYSPDGSAWDFLPHDQARSKAYRWGEDGIAGICDEDQILCFAPAFWNGNDPILKERLFGLSGREGNHGEDVKEVYYYLDATPTHSYLRFLYRYPQAAFPYADLAATNGARGPLEGEYELPDTGVLDGARYFDVLIEYAKSDPETILIRITATNRGPDRAPLHLLPQIWFRNDWGWSARRRTPPSIATAGAGADLAYLRCDHKLLGERFLYGGGRPGLLVANNEHNAQRLWGCKNAITPVKDGFHEYLVDGRKEAAKTEGTGTKAAFHYRFELEGGARQQIRLLLAGTPTADPFARFDDTFAERVREADAFYETVHRPNMTAEQRKVQRQALAGMIWSKQFYMLDMKTWLHGDGAPSAPPPQRLRGRNHDWDHLTTADIISMPDKWEYPWFAAWDWAFHAIPLAMIDIDLAKSQLELLLSEKFQHPNGQIPAYEWAFSDVNPPVQAWAVWRVFNMEKHARGERGDLRFLERCYHKLLLNFTWWVNRKDRADKNIFHGGFLGLDNISVFDRSQPLPNGGHIEQADATGWMGLFCLNMMAIGLELAQHDQVYEHLGIKFFEHFMHISAAINGRLEEGLTLWNEQDGWYYDMVRGVRGNDDGSIQLAVRSQVGLIPLFAAMVLDHKWFEHLPAFKARYEWRLTNRPELAGGMACIWTPDGARCLLSIVSFGRLQRILRRTLDGAEFLSPFGIRALSRYHLDHPYRLALGDRNWTVSYEPAESATRLFGGNSNWRGPIWFPTNFMLITALRVYDRFFGSDFTIECPTGSGKFRTLNQVALEIGRRLCAIFLPDQSGHRPVYRAQPISETDPAFAENPLFYEYFHGDTGAGLGASHQTGWTGLVAKLLDQQAVGQERGEV